MVRPWKLAEKQTISLGADALASYASIPAADQTHESHMTILVPEAYEYNNAADAMSLKKYCSHVCSEDYLQGLKTGSEQWQQT